MELKEAQKKVKKIIGDMAHPRLASFIALTEEVGEVADEIMKVEIYDEKKDTEKLKSEIADVLLSLIELANVYDVDLDKEFAKKLKDIESRAKEWRPKIKKVLEEKRKKLN